MIEFLLRNQELINVLSGLGAFISSIVAIYTLKEIIKQRLSTYKPDILLKSFLVYINKSPLELQNEELLEYYSINFNEFLGEKVDHQNDYKVACYYKIENLGFGPAKKVKCTWKYDTKKALLLLEQQLKNGFYFTQLEKLKYYFLKNIQNDNFHLSMINVDETVQTIDYLAPINVKEHSHFHSIPKEIILTHFLFYIFENELFEIPEKTYHYHIFEKLPKPSLTITFEDINGRKYKSTFKFQISFVSTQIEGPLDMTKEFGYLHFEII